MPDGTAILFSAAVGDRPFRIHRFDLTTGAMSRLEGTGASAQSPDVAADGSRVVFVGYTPEGYDLFSIGSGAGGVDRRHAGSADPGPIPVDD